MVFALINQSNMYGIGGKILLHASNVADLARQLSFRVIHQICDDQIDFVDKSDDLASFICLMNKVADGTVKLTDLLALDVEINGHLIYCQFVANGQNELYALLLAVEAEIDELDTMTWINGIDEATGYSKIAARNLLSSYDDPILFAELIEEMNEALYAES